MAELPSGGIPLLEHDLDWFKVMTNMAERSVRANLGSVVTTFVSKWKDSYKEKIKYEANRYGLTFDQMFAIYRGKYRDATIKCKLNRPVYAMSFTIKGFYSLLPTALFAWI